MANSFVLASNYTDLLDEAFKKESVTAQFNSKMSQQGRFFLTHFVINTAE